MIEIRSARPILSLRAGRKAIRPRDLRFRGPLSRRELEFFRLLGLVGVLVAGVNLQLGELLITERAARHHPLHCPANNLLRLPRQHLLRRRDLLPARVVRIVLIFLLLPLLPGELHLFGVDDDDEVAGVAVRGVLRFVLAAKAISQFDGEAADHEIGRVDDIPVLFGGGLVGHEGGHRRTHSHSRKESTRRAAVRKSAYGRARGNRVKGLTFRSGTLTIHRPKRVWRPSTAAAVSPAPPSYPAARFPLTRHSIRLPSVRR